LLYGLGLLSRPVTQRLRAQQPLSGKPLDQPGNLTKAQTSRVVQAKLLKSLTYSALPAAVEVMPGRGARYAEPLAGEGEAAVQGLDL
jgi:hypothetical protein